MKVSFLKFTLGFLLLASFGTPAGATTSCDAVLARVSAQRSVELSKKFQRILDEMDTKIVNQRPLISRMIVALLTGGHVVVQGPTGGGKTTVVKTLSQAISGAFRRTQFTPDTTPSELTGVTIFNQESRKFEFHPGTLFGNIVHADEINRAIPRTQSALLEAMEEGAITVNGETRPLPEVFFIMATQNPGQHVGTFPLPEAQLDRFLFMLLSQHSDMETERKILDLFIRKKQEAASGVVSKFNNSVTLDEVKEARRAVFQLQTQEEANTYILKIIDATRNPLKYSDRLNKYLQSGVGPRGTFALELGARGTAWLSGKSQVEKSDVDNIVRDVLRHRLHLREEALSEGVTADAVIDEILRAVNPK